MLEILYRVMQPCAFYRGVAITSYNGYYNTVGQTYQSIQQAKNAIDEAYVTIAHSIKKTNAIADLTVAE